MLIIAFKLYFVSNSLDSMKYLKDVSLALGESPERDYGHDTRIVQIHSSSFDQGNFFQWNSEAQAFENIEGNSCDRKPGHNNTSNSSCSGREYDIQWTTKLLFGLYGVVQCFDYYYLIGIAQIKELSHCDIFRCESLVWIRLPGKSPLSSVTDFSFPDQCNRLIDEFCSEECQSLYGSFDRNIAKRQNCNDDLVELGFQWNADLWSSATLKKCFVPLVFGFVETHAQNGVIFTLISRRSRFFAGTRYNSRGVDTNGSVAASVETEIVVYNPKVNVTASYVFYRGSLPVFWCQPLTGKYTPLAQTEKERDGSQVNHALEVHFNALRSHYCDNILVLNLLGKNNIRPVQQMFIDLLAANGTVEKGLVSYLNIDFHEYCSLQSFDKTLQLIDEIYGGSAVDDYSIFIPSNQSNIYQRSQSRLIRINCVDCVDRSNFAQFIICRHIVFRIMREIDPNLDIPLDFLSTMWKHNGAALALQYVSTSILYGDAYSLGRRPCYGPVMDAFLSLLRYVRNHFCDGRRHDRLNIAISRRMSGKHCHTTKLSTRNADATYILIGGCLISTFLTLANGYFVTPLLGAKNDSVFFSQIFCALWAVTTLLFIASSIIFRRLLFSIPVFTA